MHGLKVPSESISQLRILYFLSCILQPFLRAKKLPCRDANFLERPIFSPAYNSCFSDTAPLGYYFGVISLCALIAAGSCGFIELCTLIVAGSCGFIERFISFCSGTIQEPVHLSYLPLAGYYHQAHHRRSNSGLYPLLSIWIFSYPPL